VVRRAPQAPLRFSQEVPISLIPLVLFLFSQQFIRMPGALFHANTDLIDNHFMIADAARSCFTL
jgi:hypothetical protein